MQSPGHQYPYADTGSANIHALSYAVAKPHGNAVTPSCDPDAGADHRSRYA